MNYSKSLDYLNSFINYERIVLNAGNRQLNLKRMRFLIELFGFEKLNFFPVLIAGTKGKGSSGFLLSSILREAGYRTGFYNSPHLETPRERIRIDGNIISKSEWSAALDQIRKKISKTKWPKAIGELTYFEILTFLAIFIFHKRQLHFGIFEVGLGGRLDATNVLDAPLSLLTTIGLDHQKFLGNTLGSIAREKAAIMRPDSQTVVVPQKAAAMRVIQDEARRIGARLYKSDKRNVSLKGDFQRINAGAAAKAAELLRDVFGYKISAQAVAQGLKVSDWPGRFESHQYKGRWILDAAHNPSAIDALMPDLKRLKGFSRKIAFFAVASDKNAQEMLKSLSLVFDEVVVVASPDPRAYPVGDLTRLAVRYFKTAYPLVNINDGMRFITEIADSRTLVLATGSFHLVGAVRQNILGHICE